MRYTLVALLLSTLLVGCAQYDNKRGVEVAWSSEQLAALEKGVTTRQDVLEALGPPSQLIALGDETVLYYLFEKSQGNGLVLIVYNRVDVNTQYDRAVFFFDDNDLLSDYSARINAAP